MSDKEKSAEFWKKEALALVVLLRAKCSEEEWASMESRFAAECTAPAPQPANLLRTIRYLLLSWSVFYAKLPDGEYDGLGEMRTAVANIKDVEVKLAATPQVTPTDTENLCYCGNPMNWSASSGCYYPHVGCKRKFEGTSEQASPTPDKCPRCGSEDYWTALPACHGGVPDIWHSSASTPKGTK